MRADCRMRTPDEGGSPWISVETPHFALATDMERAPAEDLARMLEDTWTAMEYALQSLPGGALENGAGAEPVHVVCPPVGGSMRPADRRQMWSDKCLWC